MHLEDNHFRRVPRGAHAHGHPIPRVPPPSPHCPLPRGAPSPPPPSQVSLVEARPRRSTERFPISPVFRLRTPSLPMGLWPRFRVSRLCAWGCGDSRGTLGTSRSLGGRWGCPEVWGCWGQWGHPKPGDTLGHFGDTLGTLTSVTPRYAVPACVTWLFHSTNVTKPRRCSRSPSHR